MPVPAQPKIYHIVHWDKLASIVAEQNLLCDAEIVKRTPIGTTIGMEEIKRRRLEELELSSHPGLLVGACVPFYFCPRSVMLYIMSRQNHPNLHYTGGQQPIVHLECDLRKTVAYANQNGQRWAFTLTGAGSRYFEDRKDLSQLGEINWQAVGAQWWQGPLEDPKQAEFLIEHSFPWSLVERIGIHPQASVQRVSNAMKDAAHRPKIEIMRDWYY